MCGIAGMVGIKADDSVLALMQKTMARRGPDSSGVFQNNDCCLIHSRLAIIDPEGGKQPMTFAFAGETYTIVYNGEIYNTEELRSLLQKLGHGFSGHSDTEVVIHAYAQWGEDCLKRMNGIFAFGVWEHKRKKLFLARDRIGVKPLFYTVVGKSILFASEMKTILAHPQIEAKLDREGILQLIMLGPGRKPGSGVFRGIHELEPGCFGQFSCGKWSWKRYWKLTDREHLDSFEETAEQVRYLVTDAIKRQMISDVPIGTFLSGGLDSSLISSVCAGVMHERGETLKTFSVDYEGNDKYFVPGKFQPNSDTAYIKQMQQYLCTEHDWTVITPQQLVDCLEDATCARDLPGMADVDFSLLHFCGHISEKVKVALSGECADEIFGGYPWYRDPEIRDADGFPWAQNTSERARFLSPEFRKGTEPRDFVYDLYAQTIAGCDILPGNSHVERRTKEMVNLNFRWFMQTLLDRKDRMSMYHGLEVRVPFCDYRIAEYLYAVPWEFKDYQGREKGLLRYAIADYLPERVLNRKKSPYPKTHDPRYLTLVSQRLQAILEDPSSPLLQLVDAEALRRMLKTEPAWPWYGQLMRVPQTIAYMLQLDHWLRTYRVQIL